MARLWVVASVFIFSLSSVNATLDSADENDHLWQHQLKKTFCGVIENTRVYKQGDLKIHCAGKVAIFDNRVRNFANSLSYKGIVDAVTTLV